MEIYFWDAELAAVCNQDMARERRFGPIRAQALRRRLAQIAAAAHLADLRQVPAARLRPHADGRLLLVSIDPDADIHMQPRDDPAPRLADGSLHEKAISAMLVTAVQVETVT